MSVHVALQDLPTITQTSDDGGGRTLHGADERDPKTIQEMVAEAGERVTGITVDTDNGAWITGVNSCISSPCLFPAGC
jgi:hypothetical protein